VKILFGKLVAVNRDVGRKQAPTLSVACTQHAPYLTPIEEIDPLYTTKDMPELGYSRVFWQRKDRWPLFQNKIVLVNPRKELAPFQATLSRVIKQTLHLSVERMYLEHQETFLHALGPRLNSFRRIIHRIRKTTAAHQWEAKLKSKIVEDAFAKAISKGKKFSKKVNFPSFLK